MSDYDTRAERAAVEAELDELPVENVDTSTASTVVSVRLRGDELAAIEHAADSAGLRLGTFIRQAALTVAAERRSLVDRRQIEAAAQRLTVDMVRLVMSAGIDPRRALLGAAVLRGVPPRDAASSGLAELARELGIDLTVLEESVAARPTT